MLCGGRPAGRWAKAGCGRFDPRRRLGWSGGPGFPPAMLCRDRPAGCGRFGPGGRCRPVGRARVLPTRFVRRDRCELLPGRRRWHRPWCGGAEGGGRQRVARPAERRWLRAGRRWLRARRCWLRPRRQRPGVLVRADLAFRRRRRGQLDNRLNGFDPRGLRGDGVLEAGRLHRSQLRRAGRQIRNPVFGHARPCGEPGQLARLGRTRQRTRLDRQRF